jgi:hypothetical protein
MLIKNYREFIGRKNEENSLLENLQTAKLYLRKKVLDDFKSKDPDLKISVTDLDNLEKNSATDPESSRLKITARRIKDVADNLESIQKVRELLTTGGENSPNFGYVLTRFMEDEGLSFDTIKQIFSSLKELSQYLKQLPMPLDRYAQVVPDSKDERFGSERLIDDLEELRKIRATDRFVKELPGQFTVRSEHAPDTGAVVPSMKEEYNNAPQSIKDKVKAIAVQFDKFEENDPVKNKKFRDNFWAWVRFWARDLNDIIVTAKKHLAGALMNEIKYFEKIDEVNRKYGQINGCDIVLFKDGVLVTRVRSYQANVDLNGDTSHCIVKWISQWDNYVAGKGRYNIQYYIRNFNLGPEDDLSVIGMTIDPKQQITAAFDKPNRDIGRTVKSYIKNIKIKFEEVFKPMDKHDVEEKKKRDVANDDIVKENITLDGLKECIKYGADPNCDGGKPLGNAVASGDIEKIEFLLEQGALPVIGNPLDRLKDRESVESIKIAKMLITRGAKVKFSMLEVILRDYDTMKEVLESGFKVNTDQGIALRRCITACQEKKFTEKYTADIIQLFIDFGADISMKNFHALKMAGGYAKKLILDVLLNGIKKSKTFPTDKELRNILSWVSSSEYVSEDKAEETAEYIKSELTSV